MSDFHVSSPVILWCHSSSCSGAPGAAQRFRNACSKCWLMSSILENHFAAQRLTVEIGDHSHKCVDSLTTFLQELCIAMQKCWSWLRLDLPIRNYVASCREVLLEWLQSAKVFQHCNGFSSLARFFSPKCASLYSSLGCVQQLCLLHPLFHNQEVML